MRHALIGHTGFVGGNLTAQRSFTDTYASANIQDIRGGHFARVVCAGVSAVKWWANKNPAEDLAKIDNLISHLDKVEADVFTLISTIDVFKVPADVSEDDAPVREDLHAYGANRLYFEDFIRSRFPHAHIVRLPALFGDNLRKNALFDLMHNNQTGNINPAASFQWYPVERLGDDLDRVEQHKLPLVHLATEPLKMSEIIERFFPEAEVGPSTENAPSYDFHTKYADVFGGQNPYVVRKDAILEAMGRMIATTTGRAVA